jgi:hypothetical protein
MRFLKELKGLKEEMIESAIDKTQLSWLSHT